jgi:hypothetical protein
MGEALYWREMHTKGHLMILELGREIRLKEPLDTQFWMILEPDGEIRLKKLLGNRF